MLLRHATSDEYADSARGNVRMRACTQQPHLRYKSIHNFSVIRNYLCILMFRVYVGEVIIMMSQYHVLFIPISCFLSSVLKIHQTISTSLILSYSVHPTLVPPLILNSSIQYPKTTPFVSFILTAFPDCGILS